MLKKILSYGLVEGLAKGLNKLTLLSLPLFLSIVDYGKIGLLVSIELVLPVVTLLGFERVILRFYSDEKDFKNFKTTIFSSIRIVHLILFIALGLFYFLGLRELAGLKIFPDIFLVVILTYFQGSNLFYLNMIRVSQNHNKYFKARVLIQVIRFILIVFLVYQLNSYLGYIIGATITAIISNLFFTDFKSKRKEKFNKRTFSILFLFSWPFIFHGFAASLLGNVDKFILENYLTLSDVGLYTLAYSIGSMMVFAYIGISVFLEPLIYKENNFTRRKLLLEKFLFSAIFFGVILFLLISIISINILPLIYDVNYQKVIEYIPLLAMGYLVYPFYLKASYKMIYEKKSQNIAFVSLVSAIINICLNLYFIPKHGVLAAVVITVISYMIQAVMFILMANKFRIEEDFFEVIFVSIILFLGIYYQLSFIYIAAGISLFLVYLFFNKLKNNIKLWGLM